MTKIGVTVLASGSNGNCVAIHSEDRTLLVDCGISKSELIHRLELSAISPDTIKGILLTHAHGDHVQDRVKARAVEDNSRVKPCLPAEVNGELPHLRFLPEKKKVLAGELGEGELFSPGKRVGEGKEHLQLVCGKEEFLKIGIPRIRSLRPLNLPEEGKLAPPLPKVRFQLQGACVIDAD